MKRVDSESVGCGAPRASTLILLLSAGGAGCFGNEKTSFPPGLEPLEENRAEPPASQDEPFPEDISLAHGNASNWDWAHGRAYVHAPLARTWEALRDIDVCVDDGRVDRWSATTDVEEGYDYSFRIHNEADDIITVEFDITWRQSAVEGSVDDPELVAIRYQKTNGTEFIDLLEGSIVLRPIEDEVTELDMVEHLEAAAGGTPEIEAYLRNVFTDAVAFVHAP